jgi:hypothetical protein
VFTGGPVRLAFAVSCASGRDGSQTVASRLYAERERSRVDGAMSTSPPGAGIGQHVGRDGFARRLAEVHAGEVERHDPPRDDRELVEERAQFARATDQLDGVDQQVVAGDIRVA